MANAAPSTKKRESNKIKQAQAKSKKRGQVPGEWAWKCEYEREMLRRNGTAWAIGPARPGQAREQPFDFSGCRSCGPTQEDIEDMECN